MVRLLIVLVAIAMLLPGAASAQPPGEIGIYADPALSSCNIEVTDAAIVYIYVGHVWFEATGAGFRVDYQPLIDAGWSFVGWNLPVGFMAWGDAATGIFIAYGACYSETGMRLLELVFYNSGLPVPDCTYLLIKPDPNFIDNEGNRYPAIYTTNCFNHDFSFPGNRPAIVNPVLGLCECCLSCVIPVEQSTWGQIKALYQ